MAAFKVYLYKNLHWLLLVTSVILIGVGFYIEDSYVGLSKVFLNSGYSILGTGVFASVLKSIQFTGIFRTELREIINSDEFIKNRKDLPLLWRKITMKLYNEKFPEVSNHLEDMLIAHYLPSNSKHYYKAYSVTVDIHSLSDEMEIEYTQTNDFTMILATDATETWLHLGSRITPQDNNKIVNELVYFKVNGEDKKIEQTDSTKDINNSSEYKYLLSNGLKRYDIEIRFKRKYSLRNENYKKFILHAYLKRMDVLINHPKDVVVSFFNIGCVHSFRKLHVDIKNQIHRRHDKGLIMPYQGFGMSFEKLRS